jgi:hypothetical protein
MPGDYQYYKNVYPSWRAQALITAAAQAAVAAKTVKSANHQLFVQRITLSITTHANAKVALTVQSSNVTPVPIASRTDLTAAAGVPDVLVWDFGPEGVAMIKGESVHWLWSTGSSGPTGCATMEGYEKLVGPVALASTN